MMQDEVRLVSPSNTPLQNTSQVDAARYQAFVHNSPDLVGCCLPDGTLTFVNPALGTFLQVAPEAVIGHNLPLLLQQANKPTLAERFQAILAQLGPQCWIVETEWTDPIQLDPIQPDPMHGEAVTDEQSMALTDLHQPLQHSGLPPQSGLSPQTWHWRIQGIRDPLGTIAEIQWVGRLITVQNTQNVQNTQTSTDRLTQRMQRRPLGAPSPQTSNILPELPQGQITHFLQSITDGVVTLDRQWQLTYLNPAALGILGQPASLVVGQVLWTVCPAMDQTPVGACLRRAMETGIPQYGVEYAIDDRCYTVQVYPSELGLSVYFRNMTEMAKTVQARNQAEAGLRESEERFRQLAENIQQLFWMYSIEDKRLIYISPTCESVLGETSQACYRKQWHDWLDHVALPDRAAVLQASKQSRRGQITEVVCRILRPDGTERDLLTRAFPVRNAAGKVYRVAGIAEDITDRQKQESWLRLLESVIVNANDAVVITEAEPVQLPGPHIIYVNRAFTRMMGYEPEDVIGKTPRILQGPKTDLHTLEHIRSALHQWKSVLVEVINYRKDGSEIWVELSIFPVADQTGRYHYWVGIQRDITERKRAEADMKIALVKERELSELKSRFVSTTSHEFRTPLSTILSSADLLEYYAADGSPKKQLEHINRIQNAALNMNHLLNDILIIERAEAKKLKFDPIELELRSFCQALIEETQLNDRHQHPLRFMVTPDAATLPAYMDERLFSQILNNLLSNALKYSPANQPVSVNLGWTTSQIILRIQDEGIGIPLEDQGRLFEPFHRATNVGSVSGNGLGLAIVKQSVDIHRGQIQIHSQVNVGTTIQVTLPRFAPRSSP
ncbi:PAS domain S-box protein [Alkalinema sp. FACHB-956]|uniref:PAS domain-containing sensor histidine kinase n=1 Tax=Alkalinema sp. FACHB-956 TaxID=2692768 RepID=UPI001682FE58|nr:PAS domain S-box protein [Alkalinema sp. FACHB-956]MBD2328779.1 PAS domain S-box protein [Alkalinema sp. FACHB-956]